MERIQKLDLAYKAPSSLGRVPSIIPTVHHVFQYLHFSGAQCASKADWWLDRPREPLGFPKLLFLLSRLLGRFVWNSPPEKLKTINSTIDYFSRPPACQPNRSPVSLPNQTPNQMKCWESESWVCDVFIPKFPCCLSEAAAAGPPLCDPSSLTAWKSSSH